MKIKPFNFIVDKHVWYVNKELLIFLLFNFYPIVSIFILNFLFHHVSLFKPLINQLSILSTNFKNFKIKIKNKKIIINNTTTKSIYKI